MQLCFSAQLAHLAFIQIVPKRMCKSKFLLGAFYRAFLVTKCLHLCTFFKQDIFLLDSISNGLDSSTTYDITLTLKQASHTMGKTTVCALLQPPPEVYNLFDKVIILASGGRIIYSVSYRPISS